MNKEYPELKPCPFCGKGDTQWRESNHWGGKSSILLSVSVSHWCEHDGGSSLCPFLQVKGKTHEEAAARWNRRVQCQT